MTQNQIIKKQTTIPMCHCGKRADRLLSGDWVCQKCFDRIKKKVKEALT